MNPLFTHHPIEKEIEFKAVQLWRSNEILDNVDLKIQGGRLVEIKASNEISSGKIVIPSGVDTQVHMRVPGQYEKETAETSVLAALHGGVGALVTMPNTKPVIDSVQNLEIALNEAQEPTERFGLKVGFTGAITVGQRGEKLTDMKALYQAGVVAFTDDGKGVAPDHLMEQAYAQLEEIPLPLMQHAEMPGALGPLAEGPLQKKLGLKPYEAKLEIEMLQRDLEMLSRYPKARYHLLHATSRYAIPLIQKAKAAGLKVTAEVTPHHLYFCSDDITENNKSFKMNPPLRGEEDKNALLQALADGDIDWMATDHAPHEVETKLKPFAEASFGTTGLETSLMVLFELYLRGKLSPQRLVQVWSTAPAQFLGWSSQYGDLKRGSMFRAVVLNSKMSTKVLPSYFWGKSKNSCFESQVFRSGIVGHYTDSGYYHFV